MADNLEKHIPLTESTYYILLSLTEEMHGYGIMQKVDEISKGNVKLGPGTLYGALSKLLKQGFIREIQDDTRRKNYILTECGIELVKMQHERIKILYDNGMKIVEEM